MCKKKIMLMILQFQFLHFNLASEKASHMLFIKLFGVV